MPLLLLHTSSCRRHSFVCILLHLLITICMLLVMECFGDTMAPRHAQFATQRGQQLNNNISPHATKFIDIRDKIIEYQCHAKCGEAQTCLEQCSIDAKKSPRRGYCANFENEIISNATQPLQQKEYELSCMNPCSYDYDCPEVKKCCPSTCGPVCTTAIGVRDDQLLPEIPKILKYTLPRGHKVEITIASAVNTTCFYHVETRSHIGLIYMERKLGDWHWQPVVKIAEYLDTRSKRFGVAFNAKPGRWYEVRVAAINAYGFRGYSNPVQFTLHKRPKPPKPPADLKVVSTQANEKYFTVKIVWCPSKSNLPVEKYKITWSLYVKSKEDSLISNEAFVKDAHQFHITKLLPESSYYIQVQAISTIGRRRLKSDKAAVLFNTTSILKMKRSVQPYEPLKCSSSHHDNQHLMPNPRKLSTLNLETKILNLNIENSITEPKQIATTTPNPLSYEVRFRMNRKLGMIVLISGFRPRKERVYELCPKEVSCEKREYSAIRAKKNSLEFSRLKYNTTYMLKAFSTEGDGYNNDQIKPFNFTTPKCESFVKHFPKMEIQC